MFTWLDEIRPRGYSNPCGQRAPSRCCYCYDNSHDSSSYSSCDCWCCDILWHKLSASPSLVFQVLAALKEQPTLGTNKGGKGKGPAKLSQFSSCGPSPNIGHSFLLQSPAYLVFTSSLILKTAPLAPASYDPALTERMPRQLSSRGSDSRMTLAILTCWHSAQQWLDPPPPPSPSSRAQYPAAEVNELLAPMS
jgi:hypothetical protein